MAEMRSIRGSLQALQERVGSYFDGADNAQDENGDPLLDVVQRYPEEAAWFIKVVMFFGSVSGVLISVPCCVFLFVYWTPCEQCNRPLRIWVLVHCVLQLLQAPVRLVFFVRLRQTQQRNGDVQGCVQQLTQSSAWRTRDEQGGFHRHLRMVRSGSGMAAELYDVQAMSGSLQADLSGDINRGCQAGHDADHLLPLVPGPARRQALPETTRSHTGYHRHHAAGEVLPPQPRVSGDELCCVLGRFRGEFRNAPATLQPPLPQAVHRQVAETK
ncbi:unnamed protein product [Prorocentrum cordatum]|uniref:Uncharacterized protein n=1 Tax=Prorocentrum cordatum TaxID=2364126 RepID=A0ABN9WT87_9DINO|nr:unnamed protein product [Polarella glacialis]